MGTALLKVRLRKARLPAIGNHIRCAGSGFLHVFNPEQRFGDQRVARYGAMGFTQQFRGKPGRQFTGIPHLDAVGKDNDLDKSVVAVISVGNRIDDGLGDDRAGNLKRNGGLGACRARTYAAVDLAHINVSSQI